MKEKKIVLQATASYAHQQNSKAEQCIWTIENTAQTLIAESYLPLLFFKNAILTVQYLCNKLPTLTLLGITTLFKILEEY